MFGNLQFFMHEVYIYLLLRRKNEITNSKVAEYSQ